MSDEKKKVKDLAAELGVPVKDFLAAAKELGITAAKVAASSLTEADAGRLRSHYAPASDKPEVIVRRRKKNEIDEPAAVETEKKDLAEPTLTTAMPEEKTSEPEKVQVKQPPVEKAKPVTARIIQRPEPEAPVAAPQPTPPVQESGSASKQSQAADDPVPTGENVQPEASVTEKKTVVETTPQVEPEQPTSPAEEPKKTFAKVVRPAAFSAEPEKNAQGQTISSAPAPAPNIETPGNESRPDEAEKVEQSAAVVEKTAKPAGSQIRVISRPDVSQPAQPARTREPEGQSAHPRQRQGDNQGGRPAGGHPQGGKGGPAGHPQPAGGHRGPRPGAQPVEAPAPGFPEPYDSEQGRKKRQKGRRTVDFGGERGGRADGDEAAWSKTSRRGKGRGKSRDAAPLGGTQPVKAVKRIIKVEEFIRVSDLAHQMALKSGEIIKVLFGLGVMATINQSLDVDTATLVASEFGYEIERVGFFEEEVLHAQHQEENEADLRPRPPVVTIMGHVDHGKTSLLDALRKTSVVSGEAGGITQHIGAYHVTTPKGDIVFLDTPGHEAFTAMRARGAEVTDIVVLVVAADDGVMEQTREAVNHARAAKVPIMVAVNKMDKPEANPDRVKRELSEVGLVAEEWGGDTTFSYVSAKQRDGLEDLLDLLALQAEILELKANPNRSAVGHIVEAKLDKGRGALGTVLIQQGTLRLGDNFVCGVHSGRVRAMFNDQGKKVKEAGPSMPVEVQGFEGVPEAGEEFVCVADEKTARRIAEARALKQRERELAKESKVTLETFLARKTDDVEAIVLNLVVKSDVQGSLEAITDALVKMSTEKVRINVMHGGTGAISESDVLLATASNAIIIGFNVRPTAKAKELAETEKVDMRFYDVIYKLVEEIKSAMQGMLAPVSKEVFLGTAEVRDTFSVPKVGVIAGCHISDGKIQRNSLARLLRDGVVIYTGKIGSLRRFKDDVREVTKGYECGIGLENYNDVKVGDMIEAYEIVEEAATL